MLRFGFVTCVELGLACMEAIYDAGGQLDLVVSLPDDRARNKSGRVYVDEFCTRHDVDLVKVGHVNDPQSVQAIRDHGIDWLFIIGWSQIAGPQVLNAPRQGALGIHPTLLPEGRGRAAIPWAILKALPETGVSLFKLDEGVDTGPILAQERLPLSPGETATTLYHRVSMAHRTLIRRVWPDLAEGRVRPVPQEESRASYWAGRKPADGEILPTMTAEEAERLVRATTHPYPGAFLREGTQILRIWRARVAREGAPIPSGVRRVPLRSGVLDALEWEMESAPRPPVLPSGD